MLVIERKSGQSFFINDEIKIVVAHKKNNAIKVCIEAPQKYRILRSEIKSKYSSVKESK